MRCRVEYRRKELARIDTFIQENTQETPKNIQDGIIEAIKNNPSITRKELEALLDRTSDSIKYHLAQLTKKGIVKHEGATKSGKWIIIE